MTTLTEYIDESSSCKEHGMADKLELVNDWPEPDVG